MKGSPLTVSFSGRMRTHGQGRNTSGQRNIQNIQRWKTGVDFRPLDFGQVQWLRGNPVWKGWQLLGFGAHASAQEEEREKGERERGETEEGVLDTLDSDTMQRKSAADFRTKSRKGSCLGGGRSGVNRVSLSLSLKDEGGSEHRC